MDWNAAMEDNRRMLKRIVALLLAFAGLAERLCDLPGPVRRLVLSILRYAETIARDFVIDTALDQAAPAPPDLFASPALHGGDSAADAMRLAESFRALAVLLDRLADGNPGHCRSSIARMGLALAACATRLNLSGGTRFERRQNRLVAPWYAAQRRDSS